jgi:hypothetical protein
LAQEELLSQADNWFVFHLLSNGDLAALRSASGHFSNDLLSSLLNEPLPGHGLAWSSANRKPYPVFVRIVDFQAMVPQLLDANHTGVELEPRHRAGHEPQEGRISTRGPSQPIMCYQQAIKSYNAQRMEQ